MSRGARVTLEGLSLGGGCRRGFFYFYFFSTVFENNWFQVSGTEHALFVVLCWSARPPGPRKHSSICGPGNGIPKSKGYLGQRLPRPVSAQDESETGWALHAHSCPVGLGTYANNREAADRCWFLRSFPDPKLTFAHAPEGSVLGWSRFP